MDEELSLIQESEYLDSLGDQKPPPDQHEHMLQRLKWELEQRKAWAIFYFEKIVGLFRKILFLPIYYWNQIPVVSLPSDLQVK